LAVADILEEFRTPLQVPFGGHIDGFEGGG
jgi:hypothetical protein